MPTPHITQNIEDVVDWKLVCHRYLVMQGSCDLDGSVNRGSDLIGMDALDEQMTEMDAYKNNASRTMVT